MDAALTLSPAGGITPACEALAVSRAGCSRAQARNNAPPPPARKRPSPPRALSSDARQAVRALLPADRFVDTAPPEVDGTLLDEGKSSCALRTLSRLLDEQPEGKARRNPLTHPVSQQPALLAPAPHPVWSWDLTTRFGPANWTFFSPYVILDRFRRYVVGGMVAPAEAAARAEQRIKEPCAKPQIGSHPLTIPADRGSSRRSQPVAFLWADLGVTKDPQPAPYA